MPLNDLPDWVKQQQHNSWQIEVLIASGLILFLNEIPDFLAKLFIDLSQRGWSNSAELAMTIVAGHIFSRILLIGFIFNLVFRTIWLAYLGIQFAFPEGINYRRLDYGKRFELKNQHKLDSNKRILYVERICSLSFSITVLIALLSIGSFLVLILLFSVLAYIAPIWYDSKQLGFTMLFVFSLLLLGALDRLIFSFLPEKHLLKKLYFPIHKALNILSLRFLYYNELLTLISRFGRFKTFSVLLLFALFGFYISLLELNKNFNLMEAKINPFRTFKYEKILIRQISARKYTDYLKQGDRIIMAAIPSDVVTEDYLKLYIPYWKSFDDGLDTLFDRRKINTSLSSFKGYKQLFIHDDSVANALNTFFQIRIDSQLISAETWYFEEHYLTGENCFLGYLPMDSIPHGHHILQVNTQYFSDTLTRTKAIAWIPFFKPTN